MAKKPRYIAAYEGLTVEVELAEKVVVEARAGQVSKQNNICIQVRQALRAKYQRDNFGLIAWRKLRLRPVASMPIFDPDGRIMTRRRR